MRWVLEGAVEAAVDDFVRRALPDAGDWREAPYTVSVLPGGRGPEGSPVFRVEAEVPTATGDCWLSFDLEAEGGDPGRVRAERVHAVREGVAGDVLSWDGGGPWEVVDDEG